MVSPGNTLSVPSNQTHKLVRRWTIRLTSLDFISGHKVINDNDQDWTKDGAQYSRPDWKRKSDTNAPITHSRKEAVEAKAAFELNPKVDGFTGKVVGIGPRRYVTFRSDGEQSFTPGAETAVDVRAVKPIPSSIGRARVRLRWRIKVAKRRVAAGVSGPHTIYITMGKPIDSGLVEDGVTLRRMEKAIEWAESAWRRGWRRPDQIIESIFERFDAYILSEEMLPRHLQLRLHRNKKLHQRLLGAGFAAYQKNDAGGAWPLAQFVRFGGECQAIVRLTRAIAHQIGLPGKIEVKYVSSEPNDPMKTRILDDPHRPEGPLPNYRYALVDGPVRVGKAYGKKDGVGFNNYEAYMKYTSPRNKVAWFGGGIGRMNVPESELVKVFWGLAAVKGVTVGNQRKWKIHKVWKY